MKIFNKILIKSGIVLLLLLALSCQDLEENPIGILTPDKFYKNPEQIEAAYAASMHAQFNAWRGYNVGFWMVPADGQMEGASLGYGPNTGAEIWQLHHVAINNINAALKAIKGGSLAGYPQAQIDDLVAQGRYLRAFNYFTLVRFFGKIPYITEDTPDVVNKPLTPADRLEIAVVYDKLEADLLFAAAKMNDYDSGKPAKPCKWTAKALLAKVYVTGATAPLMKVANYAKARDMADDVIKNGPYQLLTSFEDVFKTSNQNNREIISAYQTTDDDSGIEGANYSPGELNGWDGSPVAIKFEQGYPEQPRKHNYILTDWSSDIWTPGAPIINYTASGSGLPFMGKYSWPNLTEDELFGISTMNFTIQRLADVYLIYAEAQNMADGAPSALAVSRINAIINRANAGTGTEAIATIGMSKADFNQKVIDERRYELCFELFDPYFDVLRFKRLKEVNLPDNAQEFDETDYLFPIPDIDAVHIGQNPGYGN